MIRRCGENAYTHLCLERNMELKEKIAFITGGTRGIGAAIALDLAQKGANLVLVGRNLDEEAQEVQNKIEKLGRKCLLVSGDIGKEADIQTAVSQALERFGGIDVLVHSAGGPVPGSLLDLTSEAWYSAFDVHVHAIFHLCRATIPSMKERGGGAVILIGSSAGMRGCLGAGAYGVVKGVLPQFTRVVAREHANDNIRVNCVAPGVVATRFHDLAGLTPQARQNNLDNRIPLHREGTPEQISKVAVMLIENEFITGETVTIDGGLTMRIA